MPPRQQSPLLDGLMSYGDKAREKKGQIEKAIARCPCKDDPVGDPTETLVFGALDTAHPGGKPSGWRCYQCASPRQKQAYLRRVTTFLDKLPAFATQMRVAVMLREEADKSTFEARDKLANTPWPEPSTEDGKKKQAARQATEREGYEAAHDMATNPANWELAAHNKKIEEFNKKNPGKAKPLKEVPTDPESFPAIQYHLDSDPDGPTGAPEGYVRLYTTVGSPHRDTKSGFKDVWIENGKLLVHPGAKSDPKDKVDKTFWVSAGMPNRQVFYFYKYFRDGAPEPVIRSFTIPEKVWMDSIAKRAVTEENKALQPGRSAITVDGNRAANQFGVEEEGVKEIMAHADPSSMITIGRESVKSKLDPDKDGKFYTIDEFEEVLGAPHGQLALPGGGTNSYDADAKGALKSRDVASLEKELNRTLQALDLASRIAKGEDPPADKELATWIVQLLEVNNLTPCASIPNPDYDPYGNREDRAHEETLFAYYVLTHPTIWKDSLKAVGASLRDALPDRVGAIDKDVKGYLKNYSDTPVSESNWKAAMIEAERRLDDPSLHPDEHIKTASFLFYLYRPLFRSLPGKAVDMDVKVNTRRADVLKIIPSSMSPGPTPFGLLPHDAPDAVKVFPADPHRSLDKLSRPVELPEEGPGRKQLENDLPFAGGISGSTRDYTAKILPAGQQPDSALPHLTQQQYWQFQTANSAFMISHAYHSHYEVMSVAASHPGFPLFPEGAPSGPGAQETTTRRIDKNTARDYQAWKKDYRNPGGSKGSYQPLPQIADPTRKR